MNQIQILAIALITIPLFSQTPEIIYKPMNNNLNSPKDNFVFATYVSDSIQVKRAKVLINSIRENAGTYRDCRIYIGIYSNNSLNYDLLKQENVYLLRPDVPECAADYYYAVKAYTAAAIEEAVGSNVNTIAWFDPETIVFGDVGDLELNEKFIAAIRPVFLSNKIGLKPDEQPNEYWGPVYNFLNVKIEDIPVVETEVDLVKTRAYYNCGIFSVNPALGILIEWARVQTVFLKDEDFQKSSCQDIMKKIFFHQMIFSCVVTSKLKPEMIQPLPVSCGYPLELHNKLPDAKKISRLNDITCAITENLWDKNPYWMKDFTIDEPLKSWIEKTIGKYQRN